MSILTDAFEVSKYQKKVVLPPEFQLITEITPSSASMPYATEFQISAKLYSNVTIPNNSSNYEEEQLILNAKDYLVSLIYGDYMHDINSIMYPLEKVATTTNNKELLYIVEKLRNIIKDMRKVQ